MKKVLTQRHQYNVKNVSASPDLMMKMLSGNIKCIFSRFQLYARAYIRIWTLHSWRSPFLGKAKYGEKILQSSRFNVLADFYIKVFGLRFVIIKFFKRKIANQKEPWNQFMTSFSRSRPAIENPTSRNLKCLFVSFVFPFLTKNIMGHFNYYYPNGPLKCTYWVEELYLTD